MAATSKSPEGYKCEFLDQVPDNLYCKQCSYVARDPVLTECCNITMCKACAQEIKKANKPCSNCQKELEKYVSYKRIYKKIQPLRVLCSRKNDGCTWTGQLKKLDEHLECNCEYVEIQCTQCKQNVRKRDINNHKTKQCPEREYTCKYCNFEATYKIVTEEHLKVCRYYPLVCPNRCGATFERDELEDHLKMCSLEKLKCEFSYAGCEEEFIRDKQQEHMELNTQKHLALMAADVVMNQHTFREKLQEQQEVYEKKIQEQQEANEKKIQEQQEANEKKIKQLSLNLKSEQKRAKNLTDLLDSARNDNFLAISGTVLIMAIILQVYFYQSQTTARYSCNETTQMNNEHLNHTINQCENFTNLQIQKLREETEHEINHMDEKIKNQDEETKRKLEENNLKVKRLNEKIKNQDEETKRKLEENNLKVKRLNEKIKNQDEENKRKLEENERKIEVRKKKIDLEIMRLDKKFQKLEEGWVEWVKFWK